MKKMLVFWRLLKLVVGITFFTCICFGVYVQLTCSSASTANVEKITAKKVGIVFGAGIKDGEPGYALKQRLDAGIQLVQAGKVQLLLLSGDNGEDKHNELQVMAKYCKAKGVDTTKIFLDYAGFDTYSTLYRAKEVFGVQEAVLISQKYHLARAVYIAKNLGINCQGFASKQAGRFTTRKGRIREYAASIKAGADCIRHRKPKYLGEKISLDGPSNFSLK
jgi:SanA protein